MKLCTKLPNIETRIEFVKHSTAKSVVFGFFRGDHPRMTDDRLMKHKSDFHLMIGEKWIKNASVHDMINWTHKQGIWGYCNHKSRRHKEIHFWIGKRASRESVMEFIIHEIMHAGGFRSEKMVCKLAGLGTFAYQIFESDFDRRVSSDSKKEQKRLAAWHARKN